MVYSRMVPILTTGSPSFSLTLFSVEPRISPDKAFWMYGPVALVPAYCVSKQVQLAKCGPVLSSDEVPLRTLYISISMSFASGPPSAYTL